jgi:hypothetical protein
MLLGLPSTVVELAGWQLDVASKMLTVSVVNELLKSCTSITLGFLFRFVAVIILLSALKKWRGQDDTDEQQIIL